MTTAGWQKSNEECPEPIHQSEAQMFGTGNHRKQSLRKRSIKEARKTSSIKLTEKVHLKNHNQAFFQSPMTSQPQKKNSRKRYCTQFIKCCIIGWNWKHSSSHQIKSKHKLMDNNFRRWGINIISPSSTGLPPQTG